MKLNKKIVLYGIAIVFFGLMSIGFSNKVRAALPGLDPITDIIIGGTIFDYNSCWVNLIWSCPGDPQAPPNLNCSIGANPCSSDDTREFQVNVGPQYTIGQTGEWWCDMHFGRNLGGNWDCLSVSGCSCGSSVPPNATVTCRRCCTSDNCAAYTCQGDWCQDNCTDQWVAGTKNCCVSNYNQTCYSAYNTCGQRNTGTYDCWGNCSATVPANPWYYGTTCYSAYNDCYQRNVGTYDCWGKCSVSAPANIRSCGNPATVCEGTSYSDGCDGTCWGTKICPPTTTLSANNTNISTTENPTSSTLTWTVTGASACWFWSGQDIQADRDRGRWVDYTGGMDTVRPTSSIRYNIQCWNNYGRTDGVKYVNICVSNCACADGVCDTSTCSECGFTCGGRILPNTCQDWSDCDKNCGKGVQYRECLCPEETETQNCNAQPCPPGYREVAP